MENQCLQVEFKWNWHRNQFKIKNLIPSKNKKINQSNPSSNDDESDEQLTNNQLQSAYYFLLIGIGVSIPSILMGINLLFINPSNICS